MRDCIPFPYPFACYSDLDFINCFASAYMSLEGIVGQDDYECRRRDGGTCDGCGACGKSTAKAQEDLFFVFGTLTGCNSLRCGVDGAPTAMQARLTDSEDTIDFAAGLAGYPCTRKVEGMRDTVAASVDAGRPLLARTRLGGRSPFRVVVGYDGDDIVCAEPTGAQSPPEAAVTYDDLACLYVFGPRSQPVRSLRDGLHRIADVMSWNRDAGLWEAHIAQFDYWGGGLPDAPFEALRRRFRRAADTMWFTFNCHNFAETFRHRVWPGMEAPELDELCAEVDAAYDVTHTRGWQMIALADCRDWSTRRYNELEWGMCSTAAMVLESARDSDARVLAAVQEAILRLG